MLCFLAAYTPTLLKLQLATIFSATAAVCALALNIYGYISGYQFCAYSLEDGSGSGKLQFAAAIVLLVAVLAAAIMAAICLKAYMRGFASASSVSAAPAPRPEPAPAPIITPPPAQEPELIEQTPIITPPPVQPKPEPKSEPKPEPAPVQEIKSEPEPKPTEDNDPLKALEEARRSYEEALRKFEASRKK